MNCPHHHKIFSSKKKVIVSYQFVMQNMDTVYRYEDFGRFVWFDASFDHYHE